MPSIEHVALWTNDLDGLRWWYERWLGGRSGARYVNESNSFTSYFLEFDSGARLELMQMPGKEHGLRAHVAFSLGTRDAVDKLAAALGAVDGPRLTGDDYYEAVVLDPDGNHVELSV